MSEFGNQVDIMSSIACTTDGSELFSKHVNGLLLHVDTLLVANAILMGVIVGLGAYRHRYRHHPLIRFIYLGATTLFLPIVSYVTSTLENPYTPIVYVAGNRFVTANCYTDDHVTLVVLWIGLVQIVGTNATAIVASDSREGRSIAPPAVQLVQAIWTSYLAYITIESGLQPSGYVNWSPNGGAMHTHDDVFLALPYALILAKLLFKYYAWYKARRSLVLGQNPRLIVGYMEQLQDGVHHAELASEHAPPPLIVMKEDTILVEKLQPRGYSLTTTGISNNNNNGLVTIDRVWQLDDTLLPRPMEQHKDLCLSFELFKLLRCRFARYTISEVGFMKASNFMRHGLLKDSDHERVLGVIAHELSFLHDYYYTSLPISYSESWLPILSVSISLSSIGYCLYVIIYLSVIDGGYPGADPQIHCYAVMRCDPDTYDIPSTLLNNEENFGRLYPELVSVYLLVALAVLVEVRDIASYICSNWTKVALICGHVKHIAWQRSPRRSTNALASCYAPDASS